MNRKLLQMALGITAAMDYGFTDLLQQRTSLRKE